MKNKLHTLLIILLLTGSTTYSMYNPYGIPVTYSFLGETQGNSRPETIVVKAQEDDRLISYAQPECHGYLETLYTHILNETPVEFKGSSWEVRDGTLYKDYREATQKDQNAFIASIHTRKFNIK